MITSREHIRELIDASPQKLSLHAVAKEVSESEESQDLSDQRNRFCSQSIQCTASNGRINEELRAPALCVP